MLLNIYWENRENRNGKIKLKFDQSCTYLPSHGMADFF